MKLPLTLVALEGFTKEREILPGGESPSDEIETVGAEKYPSPELSRDAYAVSGTSHIAAS
jgi:hypothetical protein